jgi:hypothetical protein
VCPRLDEFDVGEGGEGWVVRREEVGIALEGGVKRVADA